MKNKLGFTLIEMLVVVLIIGILASIALPQYQKSVEKAKLSEALMNFQTIKGAIDRFLLTDKLDGNTVFNLRDILDVDLSGGTWDSDDADAAYLTKDFQYFAWCQTYCAISVFRLPYEYELFVDTYVPPTPKTCATLGETKKGKFICKYLESQGWEYSDGEI